MRRVAEERNTPQRVAVTALRRRRRLSRQASSAIVYLTWPPFAMRANLFVQAFRLCVLTFHLAVG